jgi:diaminopimelate decarboxylase
MDIVEPMFRVKRLLKGAKRKLLTGLRPIAHEYVPAPRGFEPSRWGLTVRGGALALDGVRLDGLLERWGSPLHVIHADRLERNAASFLRLPPGRSRACEVYYSYKTNPIPAVLQRLHQLGVGAEVISPYELWLALRLGVPPERIIYNGPATSEAVLREAIGRGIQLINCNHRENVGRVARVAERCRARPSVGIRVVTGESWSGQFGVPIRGGAALQAYAEALRSPWLRVNAVHAHLGELLRTQGQLERFVGEVLAFTDTLHTRLGLDLEILDLGGSLAIPTVGALSPAGQHLSRALHRNLHPPDADGCLSIDEYVAGVLELCEEHYRRRGRPLPRILLEPGRAMTGNTQMLLGSVISLKAVPEEGFTYAILDAGQNLAEAARYAYHQIFPLQRYGQPASHTYALAGPICSPGDVLFPAVRLPRLEPGDALAIMDAGAYFVPFANSFSFPQPAVVMVEGGQEVLIRRAETFEDLVALDEMPTQARRALGGRGSSRR